MWAFVLLGRPGQLIGAGGWNTSDNGLTWLAGHIRDVTIPPAVSRGIFSEIAYQAKARCALDTAVASLRPLIREA